MPDIDRRALLRSTGLAAALGVAGTAAATRNPAVRECLETDAGDSAPPGESGPALEGDGLVTVSSDGDFEATVERITGAIEAAEAVSLVATVDHQANAAGADLELPPTTLVLFGNPAAGTPLMQANRTVALDLPQRMLVWETEDGDVNVTYNDPVWIARRHGIEDRDELLENLSAALRAFATGEGPPAGGEEGSPAES